MSVLPVRSDLVAAVLLLALHDICLVRSEASSEPLQGSLASCKDENDMVTLPILAGNPCIACLCQSGQVTCTRLKCPPRSACRGELQRVSGRCCPLCLESTMCVIGQGTYKNGESWYKPACLLCRCINGTVTCDKQRCSLDLQCAQGRKPGLLPGSCCLQCIEETGVCTSYGDPHYQTFDGKMYNFKGNCRYRLSSDCKQKDFVVRVRNERRKTESRAKTLTITIGPTHISLHRGLIVKVNRTDAPLPFYKLPYLQITKKNFVVTVLTDIGVEVLWDGDSYIEVHVPTRFKGKTCGLCGNFNDNPLDDFTLKSGKIALTANQFGESWAIGRRRNNCVKAPAPPIDSAVSKCRRSPLHHWRARKRCLPIKSHFSNCHKSVHPHRYYKSCISDVCSCQSKRCECEALLAYARACRRTNVDVSWGRRRACGISCKGGAVFDDCVPGCKQTCRTRTNPTYACSSEHCVPGCRCPAGQVWDDQRNECIFSWMCPPPISMLDQRRNRRKNPLISAKRESR